MGSPPFRQGLHEVEEELSTYGHPTTGIAAQYEAPDGDLVAVESTGLQQFTPNRQDHQY